METFDKFWETEYIIERVKRVTEDVKRGNHEMALDYLAMIQDKAKTAERMIKAEHGDK